MIMKWFMFIFSLILFAFVLMCFIATGRLDWGIWTGFSIVGIYFNFCALFE